jgi:hypothetical protein
MIRLRPSSSLLARLQRPLLLAVLACSLSPWTAQATQANVGVTVQIQQPGFYGRVQIGHTPPPVIYAEPVLIERRPAAVVRRPIYLRVPSGHERRWARYCARYQACGQPVYFVRPEGRRRHPAWQARHEQPEHHGRHHRHDHDERHDRGRGHDHH